MRCISVACVRHRLCFICAHISALCAVAVYDVCGLYRDRWSIGYYGEDGSFAREGTPVHMKYHIATSISATMHVLLAAIGQVEKYERGIGREALALQLAAAVEGLGCRVLQAEAAMSDIRCRAAKWVIEGVDQWHEENGVTVETSKVAASTVRAAAESAVKVLQVKTDLSCESNDTEDQAANVKVEKLTNEGLDVFVAIGQSTLEVCWGRWGKTYLAWMSLWPSASRP